MFYSSAAFGIQSKAAANASAFNAKQQQQQQQQQQPQQTGLGMFGNPGQTSFGMFANNQNQNQQQQRPVSSNLAPSGFGPTPSQQATFSSLGASALSQPQQTQLTTPGPSLFVNTGIQQQQGQGQGPQALPSFSSNAFSAWSLPNKNTNNLQQPQQGQGQGQQSTANIPPNPFGGLANSFLNKPAGWATNTNPSNINAAANTTTNALGQPSLGINTQPSQSSWGSLFPNAAGSNTNNALFPGQPTTNTLGQSTAGANPFSGLGQNQNQTSSNPFSNLGQSQNLTSNPFSNLGQSQNQMSNPFGMFSGSTQKPPCVFSPRLSLSPCFLFTMLFLRGLGYALLQP
jgi:nuclear pore complex protein Nup98-Nup96